MKILILVLLATVLAIGRCQGQYSQQYKRQVSMPKPQERMDRPSASSWPSSESLWSDIPKSSDFDVRSWHSWDKGGEDQPDFGSPSTNKQFKRNIQTQSNVNQIQPGFFQSQSPPVIHTQVPYAVSSQPQSFPSQFGDSVNNDFNFHVQYNEGNPNQYQSSFKRSPQIQSVPAVYPSGVRNQFGAQEESGFSPSFGGFADSVDFSQSGFDDDKDGRDEDNFDFSGNFGDPVTKFKPELESNEFASKFAPSDDGIRNNFATRPGGRVSQSYSSFTGPDGKSSNFYVPDHNQPGGNQIKENIENSISSLQGNLDPGRRGSFSSNFGGEDDEEEDEPRFRPRPGREPESVFKDSDRYKRGSHTVENFHQNDKNSEGKNSLKTFRKPLKNIKYNREEPHKESDNVDDTYSSFKSYSGGYSSDDKDAPLRPPNNYNYDMIEDEDGEGKFEGETSPGQYKRNHPYLEKEDYYIPRQPEENSRPVQGEGWGNSQSFRERESVNEEEEPQDEEELRPEYRHRPRGNKRRRGGQQQRRRHQEVDEEEESRFEPTWNWDPYK